ncbi:cell division protein FtsN [Acidovorax temperans]|uniref:Cell division protein FtsN n=1 Tax=Acidovorax temperans TaxID=80878 RepID=A0A543L7H7_9BURK|nr:SPOR domain-containing protein [Acidovorax temperans]TQN03301.1 cell division protein FtsN [Acidovorax temperans]WCT24779.1 SPOR domain-containing protein [Acidovorax temperans]
MKKKQLGGTILGFILGVIVGLGAALAVAVYVTKVPVPFLNKGGARGADQDAAEAQKNKDWDPNSPLRGKSAAKPPAPAASAAGAEPATPAAQPVATAEPKGAAASAPKAAASKPEKEETGKPTSADPLGDLAKAKAAEAGSADPYDYFVQAGAFRTQADADAQRAKLAMMGWEARVSEREQNGRPVFRVRVGPFAKRDDAAALKDKLDGTGVESALVRVQR